MRRFRIVEVAVGDFSTCFTILDMDYEEEKIDMKMSPEAFFHHLGKMVGKKLHGLKGLEFSVSNIK